MADAPMPVAGSVDELLAGASIRAAMDKHVDSLSGSPFERVVIDGERYVLKHVGYDLDWLARALDDRHCFVRTLWQAGLLHALPDSVDHTVVGMARDGENGRVAVLMRDVGDHLVPPGSAPLELSGHRRFLQDMARMHAAFWGFEDRYGLLPPGNRFTALTPATAAREAAAGHNDPVPRMLTGGWRALADAEPRAYGYAMALAEDPTPLVAALAETPATFIHGDWKAGNLGSHPDGRSILLDWGWPGRAAPLDDVAWYLAVNCDRLPTSKEQVLVDYRQALEGYGVPTAGWWDRQLELALVGGFVQLGWSKTGDRAELDWWVRRIEPVARDLVGAT